MESTELERLVVVETELEGVKDALKENTEAIHALEKAVNQDAGAKAAAKWIIGTVLAMIAVGLSYVGITMNSGHAHGG